VTSLKETLDHASRTVLTTFLALGDPVILLQILGWFVFSCILMSFIEHQVHRNLMHRANFLSRRTASFKKTFEMHALFHHQFYSKIFCDEPVPPGEDQEIQMTVHKAPIKGLPVSLPLAFISVPGALVFTATITMHHWIWNKIHLEMHKPEQRGFSNWPAYKFLARHHYLHHKHQDKNFNVVFPFADYVLGTHWRATPQELHEIYELGLATDKYKAQLAKQTARQDALREPVGSTRS
jgi:hypothetical protein